LEFGGDDESDVDPENAAIYPLVFENGKLTFGRENNKIYTWESSLVTKSTQQDRKFKNTTIFSYTDVTNSFYGLFDLGVINISIGNFIPILCTLYLGIQHHNSNLNLIDFRVSLHA